MIIKHSTPIAFDTEMRNRPAAALVIKSASIGSFIDIRERMSLRFGRGGRLYVRGVPEVQKACGRVCANWRESLPNFHIQEKSNFQAPLLVGVSNDEAPDSGIEQNTRQQRKRRFHRAVRRGWRGFVVLTGFMGVGLVASPRSCGGPSGGLK
jgi:hypothetical protein